MSILEDSKLKEILFSNDEGVLGEYFPELLVIRYSEKVQKWKKSKFAFTTTNVHETCHWHQFKGTTWGCLWTILNQCRANHILNTKFYLDLDKVLNELPYVSIQPDLNIKSLDRKVSNETLVFLENWISLSLSSKFLKDGGVNFIEFAKLQNAVAIGLSDYTTTVMEFFKEDIPMSVEEIDNIFSFDDFCFVKDEIEGVISIIDLLEGQAKVNELIHLLQMESKMGEIEGGNFLKFLINETIPKEYIKALNIYFRLNGIPKLDKDFLINYSKELAKFSTIVDISLSIPIPPFIPFSDISNLTWKEIFPPYRFLNLCNQACVVDFEFDLKELNKSSDKFSEILCKSLNYRTPLDLSGYFLRSYNSQINSLDEKWKIENFSSGKLSNIQDYYFHVFSNFHKLRIKNTCLVSNHGFSISGFDNSIRDRGNLDLLLSQGTEKNYWYYPPFIIRKNKELLSTISDNRDELKDWLLFWIFHNKILNENLIFNRSISNEELLFEPPIEKKRFIIDNVNQIYNLNLKWN